MKTQNLSSDQIHQYFNVHVRYEVQMLLHVTSGVLEKIQVPQMLMHAPIESYAIHLRNIITFLYPSTVRDSDICAKDFFVDSETWSKIRPPLSDSLEKAKRRADKEVGHLTTARISGSPDEKQWDVKNLTGEIFPIMRFFVESADRVKLRGSLDELDTYFSQIKPLL